MSAVLTPDMLARIVHRCGFDQNDRRSSTSLNILAMGLHQAGFEFNLVQRFVHLSTGSEFQFTILGDLLVAFEIDGKLYGLRGKSDWEGLLKEHMDHDRVFVVAEWSGEEEKVDMSLGGDPGEEVMQVILHEQAAVVKQVLHEELADADKQANVAKKRVI